ncbi:hypothetical protein B0T22DRAFT_435705 [Podospora appendiculata]|uniref:DUF7702 domain-containing protein n=1 Tax=Podospora appendiculata TaxID=314037 RepID=A0AAE0XFC5_9PEZI|nr:hypothetical protein B0T22DRAFT_435705 [Podospora appendiculata]
MAALTELDRISIAVLVIYIPSLFIAIFLALRHGFGRNAGWLYLVLFSLARILGSAFQIATINDRTNISLIVGAVILQSIGISALVLVMLGLVGRVLEGLRNSQYSSPIVTPFHLRLVQLIVVVGLILGIAGGSSMSKAFSDPTKPFQLPTESKAGLALIIVGYGIIILVTLVTASHMGSVEPGEKRILLAIAVALPFVLVRIIFSGQATFGSNPDFRSFGGSAKYPDYYLGMAIIMEMVVVAIFEGVGLTLQKARARPAGQKDTESGVKRGTPDKKG